MDNSASLWGGIATVTAPQGPPAPRRGRTEGRAGPRCPCVEGGLRCDCVEGRGLGAGWILTIMPVIVSPSASAQIAGLMAAQGAQAQRVVSQALTVAQRDPFRGRTPDAHGSH